MDGLIICSAELRIQVRSEVGCAWCGTATVVFRDIGARKATFCSDGHRRAVLVRRRETARQARLLADPVTLSWDVGRSWDQAVEEDGERGRHTSGPNPSCPRPEKVRYATKQQAQAATGHGSRLSAYFCVCGWHHVGHRSRMQRRGKIR